MRLLIVEDDLSFQNALCRRLSPSYDITCCSDCSQAHLLLLKNTYNLILLETELSKGSGLSLLHRLRKEGNSTPVILISSGATDHEIAAGLDAGANDYLVKPISFYELSARIRAAVRPSSCSGMNILEVADLCLNFETHIVRRGGRSVDLTATEYRLLEYLMTHYDAIVTKDDMIRDIWHSSCQDSNNLAVYICSLRRKIDVAGENQLIHTIHGVGYLFGIRK